MTSENAAPRKFDLVVVADGLHSATRRMAMGKTPLSHLGAYISIFAVSNHPRLDREEVMYSEPGRLVFAYSTGPDHPAKAGFTFASGPLDLDRRDVVAQKRLVEDAFEGIGRAVREFVSALDAADDFYLDSLSQVEPSWPAGRAVLLGEYHPRKEQVIERVLRPLHEAANAIELRDYARVC